MCWGNYDVASNGKVSGAVCAWCRLFCYSRGSCILVMGVVEELGGGRNTHSVLDSDVPCPMCISSPNCPKWWYIRFMPLMMSSLVPNGNAPSSTYTHCSILHAVSLLEANMAGVWLQSWPSAKWLLAAVITVTMGMFVVSTLFQVCWKMLSWGRGT